MGAGVSWVVDGATTKVAGDFDEQSRESREVKVMLVSILQKCEGCRKFSTRFCGRYHSYDVVLLIKQMCRGKCLLWLTKWPSRKGR